MSRLEMMAPTKADQTMEGLYRDMARRIEASPPGLCPVDLTRAFLEVCQAQTCGKCAPCRVGLQQLKNLLTDVLDGNANAFTLDTMDDLARTIEESADCAIGTEAALMVRRSLVGFREDYEEHIAKGRCICKLTLPVPCVAKCPAHVDVPGYNALVKDGRYADAIRLIRKDNPFPVTCSYICEHPCEKNCRRNMLDSPINIRGLKRMAAEHCGHVDVPECAPSTGKKVAIIGGGPGGLSTAYFLQLMGHQASVFEMQPKLGGMLRYGIPNYRLPKEQLDRDIEAILETGVSVKYEVRVGQDVTIQELLQFYDAVCVTIGATTDKKLGLEGENAEGVIPAVKFLELVGLGTPVDLTGQEVCVIGGGNVSMDAVRTAKRLGAKKVSLVYRRRIADMTALLSEIGGAVAEGVEILTLKAPTGIETDSNGHVCGLRVTPQMISEIKNGRASVVPSGAADEVIPCTTLIVAIGQAIETKPLEDAGVPLNRGRVVTRRNGGFSEIPGLFAGGDCATGPSTVINAVASAKVLAANVDEYLGFHHTISCDVEIPHPTLDNMTPCGRVELGEREATERVKDWDGIELCMSGCEAHQEASRCLRCDHFGFGIFKGGRVKLW